MLCSDLERYLEAYLDGRLGRSRTTILRRHLGLCGPCRARVERLRRYEREVGRQLGGRAGADQPSLWQGLEVDLVRSFSVGGAEIVPLLRPLPPSAPRLGPPAPREPARPPRTAGATATLRRRLSRLGGVLAIALALGTLYEMARAWLTPEDPAESAMQAYLEFAGGKSDLALKTDDPERLRAWLSAQLDRQVPTLPVPNGFRLVGGAKARLASRDAAVIAYAPTGRGDTQPTLLFVQQAGFAPSADERQGAVPVPLAVAGYNELAWAADPYLFRLVSAEPPARLRAFAP
jgi:anti-sigma factor RsiW